MKRIDLTGQRFGALTAVRPVSASEADSHYPSWLCRCDCGAEVVVNSNGLRKGYFTSCGHIRREVSRNRTAREGENMMGFYNGTKIAHLKKLIQSDVAHGITKRPMKQGGFSYRVILELAKKRIYLGTYYSIEEAVAARKSAEKIYYLPIIDEWEKLQKETGKTL